MIKTAWILVTTALLLGCDYTIGTDDQVAVRHAEIISDIGVEALLVSRASQEFVQGNIHAANELRDSHTSLDQSFHLLRHGDSDVGLPPLHESMFFQLAAMEQTWAILDRKIQVLQDNLDFITDLTEQTTEFTTLIPRLQMQFDQVAQKMLDTAEVSPEQIYHATRQLVLADRLLRRVTAVIAGGSRGEIAVDHLARDIESLRRVLEGLKHGDQELGISAIEGESMESLLADATAQFTATRDAVDAIHAGSTLLYQLKYAADEIFLDSYHLVQQSRELMTENSSRPHH